MGAKISDVLQFIRHHQDGEIAEKIRNSGLQYNMNYGVSSLLLSRYAKQIGRNQSLADALWKENFREAKLMSFMLADPQKLDTEKLTTYIDGCCNNEMVEIAVLHLFSLVPHISSLVETWIQSKQKFHIMAGFLVIARLARNEEFLQSLDKNIFLQSVEKQAITKDFFVFQNLEKAVQEISFYNQTYKDEISKKISLLWNTYAATEFAKQLEELRTITNY